MKNGNTLGSTVLQPGKSAAEFALPASLFPQGSFATTTTNFPPEKKPPRPAGQRPSSGEFLKLGIGHILNLDAFDHLLFLTALLLGCRRLKTDAPGHHRVSRSRIHSRWRWPR